MGTGIQAPEIKAGKRQLAWEGGMAAAQRRSGPQNLCRWKLRERGKTEKSQEPPFRLHGNLASASLPQLSKRQQKEAATPRRPVD